MGTTPVPRASRVVVHGDASRGFTRVPNTLIRDPELGCGAARLILWLASQSPDHAVYRSSAATELGISRTTLNNWITEADQTPYLNLEATGEYDQQGNETHVYHVHLCGKSADLGPSGSKPRPETGHGRVQEVNADRVQKLDTKKTRVEDQREDHSLSRSLPPEPPVPPKKKSRAHPLPQSWKPNHTHEVTARNLGLNVDEMLDEFLGTQAATENRSNWDKTFSKFMNDYANGNYWETAVGEEW